MSNDINISQKAVKASYALQCLLAIPFLAGAFCNLFKVDFAVKLAQEMGYSIDFIPFLGVILLICLVFYAVPKTAIFGAILITGWLGGAVTTHIIAGHSIVETVFPIIFGIAVWFALWLRLPSLKQLIPFNKTTL